MKYELINTPNNNYTPIQQILINRGIAPHNLERFLRTTDDDTHSPYLLKGITNAALILLNTIKEDKKAFLQVDSDCDGYTSSAILVNYLYKFFPNWVSNNLIIRVHEGKEHGVIVDTVGEDISLVIIPDAGSNQYEEHKILKDRGISVIVLDHHESEKRSEHAIVVNNQMCTYPNKALSGVGIVYKFLEVLDKVIGEEEADKYLDMVALGMIADMMDIRELETQHLIQKGLMNIRNTFFKSLVERQSYSMGDIITPIGVAFYIAPLINATIRMGTQQEKEIMFKSMLDHWAFEKVPSTKRGEKGAMETIVTQATRNAINVKNRQTKARDVGYATVESLIENNDLNRHKVLFVPVSNFDTSLTGLIANQLMSKYQKPIMLLNEGETAYRGSCRAYDKTELESFKDLLSSSGLVEFAEGHANAFGTEVSKQKMDNLIDYCNKSLANMTFEPKYKVDFIYNAQTMNAHDLTQIGSMKRLWGKNLEESHVVIDNIRVSKNNIFLMSPDKKPTLKILLTNGTSLIKFGSSEEEFNELSKNECTVISVLGTVNLNEWGGVITPQVFIKDYEIKEQLKYYF